MMDTLHLIYGGVQHRVEALKNNVLQSDLHDNATALCTRKVFIGKKTCNEHEERHMKAEDPHI